MTALYVKKCRSNRAFLNELFVYQSGFLGKPELIEIKKNRTLILKRIDGIPYLDVQELTDSMIRKLAEIISNLHSTASIESKVLCHWDNQPGNILWDEKHQQFFLVDFEDIRLAAPEADLSHLLLFWADVMSSAEFNTKISILLDCYRGKIALAKNRWQTELLKARKRFDQRRRRHGKTEKTLNPTRQANRKLLSGLTFRNLNN